MGMYESMYVYVYMSNRQYISIIAVGYVGIVRESFQRARTNEINLGSKIVKRRENRVTCCSIARDSIGLLVSQERLGINCDFALSKGYYTKYKCFLSQRSSLEILKVHIQPCSTCSSDNTSYPLSTSREKLHSRLFNLVSVESMGIRSLYLSSD